MAGTSLPRPLLLGLIVAAAVAVGGGAIWLFAGISSGVSATDGFFSDDQGKTFFVGPSTDLPPFTHSGKEAFGARVFVNAAGKPFVGYLERYTDAGKARAKELMAERAAGKGNPGADATLLANMEVRRPDGKEWVKANDPKALEVRRVMCPDQPTQPAMPYSPPTK